MREVGCAGAEPPTAQGRASTALPGEKPRRWPSQFPREAAEAGAVTRVRDPLGSETRAGVCERLEALEEAVRDR